MFILQVLLLLMSCKNYFKLNVVSSMKSLDKLVLIIIYII